MDNFIVNLKRLLPFRFENYLIKDPFGLRFAMGRLRDMTREPLRRKIKDFIGRQRKVKYQN